MQSRPGARGAARLPWLAALLRFQYHMAFENQTNDSDELLDF